MVLSASLPRAAIEPIALTVLGGFLGAGKTTLINHIIRHPKAGRIAVLVNDFGSLDIDAQLIVSRQFSTVSLANGCICCSIGGSLTKALLDISRLEPRPEQLIIETSGVADPAKVAAFGRVGRSFSLHGVIVLVDAEHIKAQRKHKQLSGTIVKQLSSAHLLVLNKCDRIQPTERIVLNRWLRRYNSTSQIIETLHAKLPVEIALRRFKYNSASMFYSVSVPTDTHVHDERYISWTYRDTRPFCKDALMQELSNASGVLRAKGFLRLASDPETLTLLQLVGSYLTFNTVDSAYVSRKKGAEIVFIGLRSAVAPDRFCKLLARAHLGER